MSPESQIPSDHPSEKIKKSPWICKVVLAVSLTYFLIIAVLFALALVYNREVIQSLKNYLDPGDFGTGRIIWFIVVGTLLYGLASTGLFLQLLRKRGGFYLFFTSGLALLILEIIFLDFDWLRYILVTGFMFVAGIVHFSKRCYN